MSINFVGNRHVVASLVPATGSEIPADNLNMNDIQVPDEAKGQMPLNRAELTPIVDNLNHLMQELTADIKFEMHDKTKRLMVQVVDSKDGTVLKEFPPHELLDTIAKISEYVGALLDKRA